jgi:hypothetical protein
LVPAKDGNPESDAFGAQYFFMCFAATGPLKFSVQCTFPSSFKNDDEIIARKARIAEEERLNRLSLHKMVRENKNMQ